MLDQSELCKKKLKEQRKAARMKREWYSLRSILGNDWALFYFILGGRMAGKSYAVTDFFVKQWKEKKRPFYWLRLTDTSQKKLLQNNAEKLIDPDLRRKYNLDLVTNGDAVYEVIRRDPETNKIKEKKLMARVMALSTFYNDKGSALFDKDFLDDKNMFYNICCDEFQREKSEKNTFDILYGFVGQIENLVRDTKQRLRIICVGNTLEEASDLLCAFNFIPEEFGRYKLKKKRAIIEYIEPSEAYLARRKGTVADILMPDASNFTNKIEVDKTLITKRRLTKPSAIIKFRKEKSCWYTIWDSDIIAPFNGEKCPVTIAMRPYLDDRFNTQVRDSVFQMFDGRIYMYKDLVTFKKFQKEMSLLKPRK